MPQEPVEFVCTTCGFVEEAPVAVSRNRIVICDCCGGRMLLSLDEADEASRSFTDRELITAG